MDWSSLRFAVSHILAIGLVLGGTPSAQAQLRREPDAITLAPRALIDRLRDSPTDYFRFVNRPWIARVGEVFAADLPNVPIVRLHGDAHIEQFAVTEDASSSGIDGVSLSRTIGRRPRPSLVACARKRRDRAQRFSSGERRNCSRWVRRT